MVQLGVGEGTVTRLRRSPRSRVEDVSITEASGLTLGPDGYPHPIETSGYGELKVTERTVAAILEEILLELQYMREGMVLKGLIVDVVDE